MLPLSIWRTAGNGSPLSTIQLFMDTAHTNYRAEADAEKVRRRYRLLNRNPLQYNYWCTFRIGTSIYKNKAERYLRFIFL